MKRILLPSYLLFCAAFPVTTARTATSPRAISYVFRPEGQRANTLTVELTFRVGAWRETRILLPKGWGTQNDAYRCVQNLRVSSEGTAIADTGDPLIRLIRHPVTSRVTIKYELVSDVNAGRLERHAERVSGLLRR